MIHQEFDEVLHFFVIFDDQVNFSVRQVKSDAIPTEKWHFSELLVIKLVDVLPQHPEP
jgi:hypothetical protein